jgi:glycosyltransferase involved in cell wall biosynthesis
MVMMKRRKHILFIIENQSVPLDIRVWKEALVAKDMGYDVSAICPQNARGPERHVRLDGIDIYRHPMPIEASEKLGYIIEYSNAIIWEFLLALKIFLWKPFDVIHAGNPPDHVFLLALFFKMFGVKYVFDHHDIVPETFFAKFGIKGLVYSTLMLMEKLTFWTADIVISTNESYKKIAVERGGKNPDDVFVVRNGPDLEKVQFLEPNMVWKDGADYLVGYVGVINKQEGMENLLSAVKYIVHTKKVKNIKFVIVGTGSEWDNMVSLSQEFKVDAYVKFTGFIPYRDFYEVLSTVDLCVNPEFKNEFTDKSTMIKIMDYMTFGKPIVMYLTHEGEATAGESAVYVERNDPVEFAEAILELVKRDDKREKMGAIGRARIIEKLNWGVQQANLRKAYRRLQMGKQEKSCL